MEKNISKWIIAGLVLSLVIAITLVILGYSAIKQEVKDILYPETVEIVQESDTCTITDVITIDDVLQFRKDTKQAMYFDSVFLNMPDVALIAILMKYGTDLSNGDIADEYLRNKKDYNNVEIGASINSIYGEKHYIDSTSLKQKNDSISHVKK